MTSQKTREELLAETVNYFAWEMREALKKIESNEVSLECKATVFSYMAAIASHCQQEAENLTNQAA